MHSFIFEIYVCFVCDVMICFHYASLALLHLCIVCDIVINIIIMCNLINVIFTSGGCHVLFIHDVFCTDPTDVYTCVCHILEWNIL